MVKVESSAISPDEVLQIVWDELRQQRNMLLAQTDFTQLADTSLANKQVWADYRQALRDLPANTVDPTQTVWPVQPS